MSDAPAAKGGLFEDVVDIFINPSAVYERNKSAGFARPALIQTVVFLVLVIALKNLVTPYFDAEFERAMTAAAAKGQAIPENAMAMSRKISTFGAMFGPLIAPWFVALFGGLFTMIGSRIVGAKLSYGQSATIASWSYFPAVIGYISIAVQGAFVDQQTIRGVSDAQFGPARFVDPSAVSPALLGFLQNLDLFSIWTLVLTAIGISVVARTSRSTGAIAAVIRWGLLALVTLGFGLMRPS